MGGGGPRVGLGASIPLDRLAPGGRLTVSTEEVQETKVGSDMSCLFTERLRGYPGRLYAQLGELWGGIIVDGDDVMEEEIEGRLSLDVVVDSARGRF